MPAPPQPSRARIVATLGPASESADVVRFLIRAGADAFRLNCSHGAIQWHRRMARTVRRAAGDAPVALVADLQGPRIRIGRLDAPAAVRRGDSVTLASGPNAPPGTLPTTYRALADDLAPRDSVLIDNGLIRLEVVERVPARRGRPALVRCRVLIGGEIGSNKGLNLPGVRVSAPALTAKDRGDARAAVRLGADYIALSFVRSPDDLHALRSLLRRSGADIPLIAKIERPEAVACAAEIIEASDAIMVARGDLGVELPQEKVPGIQKRLIALANAAAKPVITATEMLQSMIDSPRPTRAEASDVANAILDGTDAVMLSGETAVGRYPVDSVAVMERIAREAERIRRAFVPRQRTRAGGDFTEAVADAACAAAADLRAAALVVFTMSGRTARLVAQRRPHARIIALTPSESARRRLALVWGVTPVRLAAVRAADRMIAAADRLLTARRILRPGDTVVIVGGAGPLTGATNFTKIHRVR